jgi:leader peptidase (prepilin peptidase) / N-methyltransferase
LLFFVTLLALLVLISITDVRLGIIPNWMNAAIAGTGLLKSYLNIGPSLLECALAALLSLCVFASLRYLFAYWRGYPGLGMGDVKFIGAASIWIGFVGLPMMILIASVSGLTLVLLRNLVGYPTSQTTRLPFGPHLAVGLATVCLFNSIN